MSQEDAPLCVDWKNGQQFRRKERVSMMVSNWQCVCERLQETELDINTLQTHYAVAFRKPQGSSR